MNTQSLTEAELVGVDESLPLLILWSRLSALLAQGMNINDNTFYQDILSAICMKTNGILSCTKRTKHIEIQYFYITDKVKSGEVTIKYCPTKEKWQISSQNHLLGHCSRNIKISSNALNRVTCPSTRRYMIRILPTDWAVS